MTGNRLRTTVLAGMLAAGSAWGLATAAEGGFRDPLDTPARIVTRPDSRPLMAVTQAGARLVAVGLRGLIVSSDDSGKTWLQASAPVQSDLLAVHFPSAMEGWAVGHDGVILHSDDGGKHWEKQLDGRNSAESFKSVYSGLGSKGGAYLKQLGLNYKAGPALPFLDVWFEDALHGYAVGSFGMLVATNDGGKRWEPWLHRIDNPQFLNLNAIRGIGSDVYIAGERGQVYRLDRAKGRFERTDTGYIGSFFGIVGNGSTLVVYGLRGTVYRSDGAGKGAARWQAIAMPSDQTLAAGVSHGDGFLLANAAGEFLSLDKTGQNPRLLKAANQPMRLTGIDASDDKVIVAGLDGIRVEALPVAAH